MAYLVTADLPTYAPQITLADPQATAYIKIASELIDRYCFRTLGVTTYTERIPVNQFNQGHLTYKPIVALTTVQVRYGRKHYTYYTNPVIDLYLLNNYFGPPRFQDVVVADCDFDPLQGYIWLPLGLWSVPYEEANLTYTAGYATVPEAVKCACGLLVAALVQRKGIGVVMEQIDDLRSQFKSDSLITPEIEQFLTPYIARSYS